MDRSELIRQVAEEYFFVNRWRRSVIIFHVDSGDDVPGTSTVVMPNALSSKSDVVELIQAISKVVEFDCISIDALYTGNPAKSTLNDGVIDPIHYEFNPIPYEPLIF